MLLNPVGGVGAGKGRTIMTRRTILKDAYLLTMDERLGQRTGDILIEDGVIADVADSIRIADAELVNLAGAIVMPGMIDTHIHLWQSAIRGLASETWGREYFGLVHPLSGRYRPADMYASTLGGAIELLHSGTTTVFDFCHATNSPQHAEASLRALDDSGIRGIFGFCFRHRPEAGITGFTTFDERHQVLEKLVAEWSEHERVSLGVALNNIDHVSPEVHTREVESARRLGLRQSIHSNLPGQVSLSAGAGLLGEDISWVHAGPIDDDEIDLLVESGGSIAFTPEIEAAMMGIAPRVGAARRRGVPVSIGTDVPSALNGSLLTQLRIARAVIHAVDGQTERAQNRSGTRTARHPSFDTMDLLRLATIDGARVLGMADTIGSISVGKAADLLVIDTAPFGLAAGSAADFVVYQSTARNLAAVYVGGEAVVSEGRHTRADLPRVRQQLDETRDWVLGRSADSEWPEIDEETRARYEAGQGKAS
ncbi:amidohydrolase family protein [Microbacterium sp. LWS13-1.2]|uniref:Amidohydrolase family protein n=1 Tax=Microbacterium sp. LWS13-1.2 TaxID=3135264 RepID=A0AAU6SBF6_9MICO